MDELQNLREFDSFIRHHSQQNVTLQSRLSTYKVSISVCKHEYINGLAALLQVIEWWPPSPAPASKSFPSQPLLPLKCQTADLHLSKSGSREMECPPSSAFLPVSLLFRLGQVGPSHIQGIFPPPLTLKTCPERCLLILNAIKVTTKVNENL